MLIMRRGEVMSHGDGLVACGEYAKKHKTKVKTVEICRTLGGYCELVVHWADHAVGMYWSRDADELRAWVAEQKGWPKLAEYSVQVMPLLLDIPAPVQATEQRPEEAEEEPEEPPARVRRSRPAAAEKTPEKPAATVAPKPAPKAPDTTGRITRVRGRGNLPDVISI